MNKRVNKTIMYVEDESELRDVIIELLKDEGFHCLQACNGEDAMNILAEDASIDLLISDFRMPKVDGVHLLEWCRAKGLHFPVIFFTGMNDLEPEEIKALDDCCSDFLKKPAGFELLLESVKKAFKRHHDRYCHPPTRQL